MTGIFSYRAPSQNKRHTRTIYCSKRSSPPTIWECPQRRTLSWTRWAASGNRSKASRCPGSLKSTKINTLKKITSVLRFWQFHDWSGWSLPRKSQSSGSRAFRRTLSWRSCCFMASWDSSKLWCWEADNTKNSSVMFTRRSGRRRKKRVIKRDGIEQMRMSGETKGGRRQQEQWSKRREGKDAEEYESWRVCI